MVTDEQKPVVASVEINAGSEEEISLEEAISAVPAGSEFAQGGRAADLPPLWVDLDVPEIPPLDVPYQAPEMALAARRARVEAFGVSPVFLMDTGGGHDIGSRELADGFPDYVHKAKHMNFVTANGRTDSHDTLLMKVETLGITATPYVLPDSPALLSVGVRCRRKGFSFIWLAGMCPCMVTPRSKSVV